MQAKGGFLELSAYNERRKENLRFKRRAFYGSLGYKVRGRNFRRLKVLRFSRFLHFSQKFFVRHNLKSKFAKVFAREITENSRLAKVFSIQFFRFVKFLRCCSLITPIGSLVFWAIKPCKLSPRLWAVLKMNRKLCFPLTFLQSRKFFHAKMHLFSRWQKFLSQNLPEKTSFAKVYALKGSVSSSIPCTCRLLAGLCLSPFSWAMKMATTKANQETTRARHAG